MKRSLINKNILWAGDVLKQHGITLPEFAYWDMQQWRSNAANLVNIKGAMLGWDVTDFGNGNFLEVGGVLFTLRNGNFNDSSIGTPYAEKIMVLRPGQRLPIHMHKTKHEDIINRCGANYCIKLWNTGKDGQPDCESDVEAYFDGIKKTVKAGETLVIQRGCSITLPPYLYHTFWGQEGSESAVVGEVSSVNDDNVDNHFAEPVNRFSEIEEDEPCICPLCNEYSMLEQG